MERFAAIFALLAEVWAWAKAELAARRKALFRARVVDDPVGVLIGQLGRTAPTRPVLSSMTRATLNGVKGVWMDERDAGALALWLEEVSP